MNGKTDVGQCLQRLRLQVEEKVVCKNEGARLLTGGLRPDNLTKVIFISQLFLIKQIIWNDEC